MQLEQTDLSETLSADSVLRFLVNNPEFFVSNQDILPRLRIPHDSGNAVSLIEKQVSVLRGKCGTLENSLRDLISVARENENLHQRLHGLIQEIISATTLEQIVALTRNSLQENFNADQVHISIVESKPRRAAAKKSAAKSTGDTPVKAVAKKRSSRARKPKAIEGVTFLTHNDKRLKLFSDLFDGGETVCGLPSAEHLDCLVGGDCAEIASTAMIPLYHKRELGIVLLTSKDESRFAAGKGVMFLNQLGELLSRRLHTYGSITSTVSK
ncbi:MAG: DUF484 family protein [Granulosicoccus sp.]